MTRLAVLSDIHGNLPALEAVLADLGNFSVDQVLVAGDCVNMGPFSKQVAEIVIEKRWPVIRGNNEYFLLDYNTPRAPAEWNDPVRFAPLAWLDRQCDKELKTKIAAWPDALCLRHMDSAPIQVFHGMPGDPWASLYWTRLDEEIKAGLGSVEEGFVICGHTHLPMDRQCGKWRIFNPGSVGYPLDGLFSASYLLLEGDEYGWKPVFRRLPFDYAALFRGFATSGYTDECGPIGQLVVQGYRTARPWIVGFLNWRKVNRPDAALDNALVDEFVAFGHWWEYESAAYRINM